MTGTVHTGRPKLVRSALLWGALVAAACAQPAERPAERPAAAPSAERARNGLVVSVNVIASEVGRDVLAAGGNAVDAAVATGFALAVVHPAAGNIGGGGFMVIRQPDGRATAYDFREKAPLRAHARMFLDGKGEYSESLHHDSHLSVGVPGTVAGFAQAHAAHGKLPWARLVEPAVRLAREGFVLSPTLARSLAEILPDMKAHAASVRTFSKGGEPYAAGEVFRQPELAETLGRIMREGRDGFYRGETARLLAEEMRRGGGLITEEDLARYEARERVPVRGTYRGYEIIGMPPPSSGGVAMIQMLNVLEGFDLRAMGHNSPAYIHHLTEAMRRAFRDRARWVADPDFAEVPVARLTSKEYAAELRSSIEPVRATPSLVEDVALVPEGMETTHFSVVDSAGTAVAVTYTLEYSYGSRITVPGAGFLLNNEMGDFNAKAGLTTKTGLIGTEPNLARPEQRMISSMTPTIVARDGKLVAVVGSPGGRTIINTVLQVVLNVVEFGLDIQTAVDARRIHHQWLPDELRIEEGGADAATVRALEALGHTVRVRGVQGSAQSLMIDPATGARVAGVDRRSGDAGAAGH